MKIIKRIGVGLLLVVTVVVGLAMHHWLPRTMKVQLTGQEVKLMDRPNPGEVQLGGRDVRFLMSRDPQTERTHVFRNEDTRWGWPPYLKFDSGDLAGDAASIIEHRSDAIVLVTYYGWRITWLDLYPNVVDMEIVEPDYKHLPLFNIFFFTVILGSLGYVWFRVWRWRRKRRKAQEVLESPAPGDTPSDQLAQNETSPLPQGVEGAEEITPKQH